jgi:hypothetical protein
VRWKEIVVEPGLRLFASDEWEPGDTTDERIRAALSALRNGGTP